MPEGIKKEPPSQTLTHSQNCAGPYLYLGEDLLSLFVVATGVGEVGELIRGVGVLLSKVVVTLLSEVGDKVSVVDGWSCEDWDGLVVLGG